jgi:hypothetical protein
MQINLEAIKNNDIGLNAASIAYSVLKIPNKHIDGKNYFAVVNIPVIVKGETVNLFAIGATRVLYNRHCFTKPDI